MTSVRVCAVAAIVAVLVCAGCGDDSSTAPPTDRPGGGDGGGQTRTGPEESGAERRPSPPPKPTLPRATETARRTVLVSEEVAPSAESRTVRHGEQVAVTVPGGLLRAPALVTIAAVENEPPANSRTLRKLCAWDISIGDLHELDRPVTIEMAVDPAALAGGGKPEDRLVTGYWSPEVGAWITAPFRFDAARGRLVVEAEHLSLRSAWDIGPGTDVSFSTHFRLIRNTAVNCPMLDREMVRDTGDPGLVFGLQVRSALETAWDAYAAMGFTMPSGRTDVYIDDWGVEATAQWRSFVKDIDIPVTYDNLAELRHDSAHELFHAVQNQYFWLSSMLARTWWMEATADYAADRVAWGAAGGTGLMGQNIRPRYCDRSFTRYGGATDDPYYRHEYHTAHLVSFLCGGDNARFKAMWDKVCGERMPLLTVKPLEDWAAQSAGTLLAGRYRDFAAWLLLSEESPALREAPPLAGSTVPPGVLPANRLDVGNELELESDYTAALWGVRVAPPAEGIRQRQLRVAVEGQWPPSARAECAVYVLPSDARVPAAGLRPAGLISRERPELRVEAAGEQWLALLAVNATDQPQSLGLRVEALPQLEVGRPIFDVEQGVIGFEYTFRARFADLRDPGAFTWNFGDGAAATGDVATHKYAAAGSYTVTVDTVDGAGRRLSARTTFVVAPDKELKLCEVDFLIYRRYKNPMGQSKQACGQFSLSVTDKATGKVVDGGESVGRNGHLSLPLAPGSYSCVATYNYTRPPDHGTAGAEFRVTADGRNQVEVETPPCEER